MFFSAVIYRLCDDIDPTNKNDVANLYSELAANFEGIVQYNKDNRGFEVCLCLFTSFIIELQDVLIN